MHTHDDNPCWDAHCAPHLTHHDASVRELIARAEARGAERVARAVEKLADEFDAGWAAMTVASVSTRLRDLLAEHCDEATR